MFLYIIGYLILPDGFSFKNKMTQRIRFLKDFEKKFVKFHSLISHYKILKKALQLKKS